MATIDFLTRKKMAANQTLVQEATPQYGSLPAACATITGSCLQILDIHKLFQQHH